MTKNQIEKRKLEQKQMIFTRIGEDLIQRMDEYVKANYPHVNDRTQLIKVAITEYLERSEKK